jgi:hypothetical protein
MVKQLSTRIHMIVIVILVVPLSAFMPADHTISTENFPGGEVKNFYNLKDSSPDKTTPSQAVPVLPSSFYGTVQVDGANVEPGTRIKAIIENRVFAGGMTQIYEGSSVYSINIPGDDNDTSEIDGGREGDQITFEVGGLIAEQSGAWHSGTNVELNLTFTSQDQESGTIVIATPSPTHPTDQSGGSESTQSTEAVQEPAGVKTQTESPKDSANPAVNAPSSTSLSVQGIQTPTKSGGATPVLTVVHNPESSLNETQIIIQAEMTPQTNPEQTSSNLNISSSVNQLERLSTTEIILVVAALILIGGIAFWIWTQRK